MYIELVRRVIEEAVRMHATETNQPEDEVLEKIAEHIEATSREHRKDEPQIEYNDPLCRLGYLYMHVAANATLFERVLIESGDLQQRIQMTHKSVLNVCSFGGGPGTELLGITKHLLRRRDGVAPRKIAFTVIDNVPEWAETWQQLADAVEEEFRSSLRGNIDEPPTINQTFLPLDVLDLPNSNYTFQFKRADLIVFNYLFSENKTKLDEVQRAIEHLARIASEDCIFVVIDRLENDRQFTDIIVSIFKEALNVEIVVQTENGTLDRDEQTIEMGEMLIDTLKRTPRVKFSPMSTETRRSFGSR